MIDKDSLPLDRPRRTPDHPTKSHVVKTKVDGKEKIIRFGEQGAETAGKPKAGESDRMKAKRASFKARHAKNIAKGKSSPAYWADKVKWAKGGEVSMKPPSPSDIITDLLAKVRKGQAAQQQEQSQLEAMRQMYEQQSRRASSARSPLFPLSPPSAEYAPPDATSASPTGASTQPLVTSAEVEPLPASAGENPFRAEAVRLAEKYGLPTNVFVSLVNQESRFNPEARSRKGAIGLAQLMPATAKDLGVDPTDPLQNLEGGARYLRQQLDRFGSLPLALAAYNAGPGNVRKHGGIPPFKETQNYVAQVLKGAETPGYAGGGVISKLARKYAKESAEKVPEQKMLQGFYRGYAGDYDAMKAAEDAGTVFASPQKPVGEYYGRKRAAQTGEEPHLEMLLADPFAGKKYGHAVPLGPMNRSGVGQTMAREFSPEEIEEITRLFNEGGYVSKYAEGGEVEAEIKATPQNPVLGKIARGVKSLQEMASNYSIPEFVPLFGGDKLDELLGLPGAAREAERISYGNYPIQIHPYAGRTAAVGYVPTWKSSERMRDTLDTAFLGADVLGLGKLATKYGTKGAMAAGKAFEQAAERAVPRIMERGGLGSEMLQGLASGTRSQAVPPTKFIESDFVPGVEAGKELIVHHNIPAEKLAKVEKVGGMPVPSLAVSNANNPLSGFGEISLIGNPSMASPSSKNPVFPLDAYTKRAPGIDYNMDRKSEKALEAELSDVAAKIPGGGYYVDRLINNWQDHKYSEVLRAKFLEDAGYGLPDKEMFPKEIDFVAEIRRRASQLEPEYQDWLQKFNQSLPEKGVNIEERIFKGFTPSGNRRYAEVTLENLVKEMKGGAGTEGINYGVGNLRAVATPKFKKLDDVKASRDKIIPHEEMSKVKDQVDSAYQSLLGKIRQLDNQSGYGYSPEDILYEIGATKNVNMIDKFVKGASDELKADIGLFVKKLKDLPTEYFEIKPQRAVSVSEFEGAIVPSNTPKSSIDYLRKQGIDRIYYYSTPEERVDLFKKFGDKMFQVGVGAGIGAAGMEAKDEDSFEYANGGAVRAYNSKSNRTTASNINKPGYAAGGAVSAYDQSVIDALVNQVLEGEYV